MNDHGYDPEPPDLCDKCGKRETTGDCKCGSQQARPQTDRMEILPASDCYAAARETCRAAFALLEQAECDDAVRNRLWRDMHKAAHDLFDELEKIRTQAVAGGGGRNEQ